MVKLGLSKLNIRQLGFYGRMVYLSVEYKNLKNLEFLD